MEQPDRNRISKATRNYYLNIFTLLPFLLLVFSGLVVLRYHGGQPYEKDTIGLNGYTWLWVHRILGLVVIPLIMVHLWMHAHWVKKLFNFKQKKHGKNHDMNVALFVVFTLTAFTALISWFIFPGKSAADLLREVHNKLGLALIFFFVLHLANYFKWLLYMTRKLFNKK